MKLLRNRELRITLLLHGALTVIASATAWGFDPRAGVGVLALCGAFLLIHWIVTARRYRNLSDLSTRIDRILHGDRELFPLGCEEGELSILQSEIGKMVLRMKEQQEILQQDKVTLANAIADISHQIRTPLTSLNLLVSLLSEDDLPDERRKALTREVYELLSRIDRLITALLKMSKLDAGTVQLKQEKISLTELAKGAASPLSIPLDLHNVTMTISGEGEFYGDIAWTEEALGNILKNCIEHTPDGGVIEVCADETALYSELIIRDNGRGIAKEDLPHVFERFYKGKNSDEKSFGIGLSLAKTIITAQNGTIRAENRREGGAQFTIRFFKGIV